MKNRFPKLVSGSQMTALDRETITRHGIAGVDLMERAGVRVVEVIREMWDGLEGLAVAVVCGKGNNGGDGFVVARLLHEAGVRVQVYATDPDGLSPDAAHHCGKLTAVGVSIGSLPRSGAADELAACDIVVDALLGTGLRGKARPDAATVIAAINRSARPVVAVDMPSGVEADTGNIHGSGVSAAVTVTFGLPKVGQLFYPGRAHCGSLQLVDIGFPPAVLEASSAAAYLISGEAVGDLLPSRAPDVHKGDCGSVTVIAGSVGMTGAAALTAATALRSGAGRVTAAIPESLNDIMEVKLTEAMTWPLPEVKRRRCLALRGFAEAKRAMARSSALAIGPGLGSHPETGELVRRLLSKMKIPAIVDADGINALAGHTDIYHSDAWRRESRAGGVAAANRVLTPHVGEFCRLTGAEKGEVAERPLEAAQGLAARSGAVVVLKGAPTCVAVPDGEVFVNPTGNAGMATAGSGDVLTGLIAGLVAQGLAPEEAAVCGVFLHGRAGDIACDRLGEWGVTAGDLRDAVPEAILTTYKERQVTDGA